MEKLTLHKTLVKIQQELKAPKGQVNSFGGYKYRSCEDILTAVKPLLGKAKLTIADEVVLIGNRYYVKAQARLSTAAGGDIFTTAYAREEESKKGMDGAQITGAASSYARKYALNGLFAIDDTKDADTQDNTKPAAANFEKPKEDTYQVTKCETCGGNMRFVNGTNKAGKKFAGWFCTTDKTHPPIWSNKHEAQ